MRMLVHVKLPHEPFNAAVRNGTAGKTIERSRPRRPRRHRQEVGVRAAGDVE